MRCPSLLPLLTLAVPFSALAQQGPVPPAGQADIVVLGQPLPLPPGVPAYGSVTIGRARLTGDATGRVEDVLLDVAGFQQFRRSDSRSANPSAQGVTLRALGGNASSRALVLLDGVPLADPFFGYIPFNALAVDRLAGVRVTRGGGAGAFGAGAVAGTIELASATRADLPPVAGELFYGSNAAVVASGSVSPDAGGGFVSLSGKFERGDGFYTTPPGQFTPATVRARYRDGSASLRAVVPIDAQTEIQARGLLYRDARSLRFAGADSSSAGEDASVRLIHRGAWAIDALAYVQARNFSNRVISATSFRLTLDQRNTPATGVGGKIELRPPVGPDHVLRIGADARLGDGQLYENAYAASGAVTTRRNAGGHTSTTGLFVEDDWTLGRLVLTAGVRGDRWTITRGFFRETTAAGATTTDTRYPDRDGFEGTGRAGALFHASDAVALRAAGYTGFRLPTLNELYRPFVVFPITTQANAALGLERLRGAEGGLDLKPVAGVTFGVTAFYNRLDGAIANVTIAPNLRQRRNVDTIVAKGIELTAHAARGRFSFDGSYAFSDSRVHASGASRQLDGFVPAQSPRHSGSATLAWASPHGFAAALTARHVGKQYEDDLQTDVLPPATTLDGVLTLPVGQRVGVVLRGENLFDETVITRNSAGSIDFGTPRTLWIGVRLR
ncbi:MULTISPECIES: TonB-dependent receptor [Sphingomonas]|jgi:outer membrane receptor protein involved in Fe transport|uniref:TonB-dependent receptor n=1 Tax=Sphingomonas echinoides TaxID=59803 RepID=A0ABU4PT04_9SPHN|nr:MULTISPECIES: TonB-dependent receptor [Sphingomonas]MDX5986322.1 TonB-dependent receptor [Sphingomonas echinoides]